MKNKAKKLAAVMVTLLWLMSSLSLKATNPPLPPGTCDYKASILISNPYLVHNGFGCPVKITFTIKKPGCTTCLATGGTGMVTIVGGGTASIPIPASCVPGCDIVITLTEINGIALFIPITVSFGATHSSNACNTCGCGGAPTGYAMDWTPGATNIHP
jgi:hypothetical protein